MKQEDAVQDRALGTADALVAAGRKVFARRGYDGASVRAITAEAGANLGAVTYHFGSKKALYEAVVADCLEPVAGKILGAAAGPGAPLDRIEAAVRGGFEAIGQNPDFPQLLLQEVAAGRTPPEPVLRYVRRLWGALSALVAEGQRDGSIRSGDPLLMALSTVAQPVFLMLTRPVSAGLLGLDPEGAAFRESVSRHAVAYVRAALARESEA
jgi:AcrR family transcriptional regulator